MRLTRAQQDRKNELQRKRHVANPEAMRAAQRKYRAENKDTIRERNRKYAAANPDKVAFWSWKGDLKRFYGITPEQFNELLRKQNSRCAICSIRKPGGAGRWHVDHCHRRKKVRGLLCQKCNMALGLFVDNIKTLESAIKYLRKHA